jgi:hypothetical protein
MATTVTVSMTDACSTSSGMMAVAAATSATTRRVSPSTRTRASSPGAYTASMPITCTTSATLIRTTKCANNNNKHKQQIKWEKQSRCNMYATRHVCNNHWTSSKSSRLAEPMTPSLVTKDKRKQRQQKNYHFCSNPKINRMLVVQCSGLATATSS